ncbi:MAG: hypothetical protein ACJAYU_000116 [Bradymonadia bacterium]|jgi:hypothetical protein
MRCLLLVTALFLALPSAPATAELVRIELGGSDVRGVPSSYEELLRRATSQGLDVTWQDQPYYDSYYSSSGGATFGALTVNYSGDTVTVSWVEFDDVGAATRHAAELDAMNAGAEYLHHRVRGRYLVQCYAHSGNSDIAEDLIDRLTGR